MNDFFNNLFEHQATALCAIIGFASYMIIIAYYSGKWPFIGLKLNSRTKKSKRLVTLGYVLGFISLTMLSIVLPIYHKKQNLELHVTNPFLGNWTIIESNIEGVEERSELNVFVSEDNTLRGNITERRGKEYAFLRNNILDHYNYLEIEGDFSSYAGLKLDHHSVISEDFEKLRINCFTKDGLNFGEILLEKR